MNRSALFSTVLLWGWSLFTGAFGTDLQQIHADPDVMGSGAEYHGTLQLKAGDRFSIGWFTVGGFVEVRNEERFNQGVFPNHNWRGFISGNIAWPIIHHTQGALFLFTGLEHESAHATMGIVEHTENPYAMIYDHQYRKCLLNALPVGAELVMYDARQQLLLRGSCAWYFLSKNTPELTGLETANSGGITLGGEYRKRAARYLSWFVSIHNRYVFSGAKEALGTVYVRDDADISPQQSDYPVLRGSNTFSATAGVAVPLFKARKSVDLYVRYLYGNIYGYIDSREKRSVLSVGCIVWGK